MEVRREVRKFAGPLHLIWSRAEAIEIHDLESNRTRMLIPATPGHDIAWAALSHDGRHLTWHEVADESDLWLAMFEQAPECRSAVPSPGSECERAAANR